MIKKFLLWALSKFETEPKKEEAPWPFPAPQEKRRPQVKKATTRTKKPVAKKATVKASPLLKAMKQEQKEVKKILKQKAK